MEVPVLEVQLKAEKVAIRKRVEPVQMVAQTSSKVTTLAAEPKPKAASSKKQKQADRDGFEQVPTKSSKKSHKKSQDKKQES